MLINECEIIDYLLNNPNKHYINDYFAYFPMRLTGTGLAERIIDGQAKIFNRDIATFASNDLMQIYANVPVCLGHPKNETGDYVALSLNNSELIVGNAIFSFLRDNEIWIIARLFNNEVINALLQNDFSTSPYFISLESKESLKNDIIINEVPILCNHLAIVESGFWDKKNNSILAISKGDNMITTEASDLNVSKNEVVDSDDSKNEVVDSDDSKNEVVDSDDSKNEVVDSDSDDSVTIKQLLDKIQLLEKQVDSLISDSELNATDSELKEKDSIIEAINEIADSNDLIDKVRFRVGDKPKDILQKFLKANKKHISFKYHALVDSIPNNAYDLVKSDVLNDLKQNLNKTQKAETKKQGWQVFNNSILGYKF